jgi:hypothetical protein
MDVSPVASLMSAEEKYSAKLSPPYSRGPKAGVSNRGYGVHGKNTKMSSLYYNPEKPTAFSTLDKLSAAIPRKNMPDIKTWLQYQDVCTMYPVRKRFLCNPYTVTNIMDV